MEREITLDDLRLCVKALWKNKALIIMSTLFTLLIGIFLTLHISTKNIFVASSSIYSAANGSYQESTSGTTAMLSYVDMITSRKVCEMAAAQLSNERNIDSSVIQSMITVTQSSDNIIRISAVSTDGSLAVDVTNSIATSFVQEITRITGYDSIQILDTASEYYVITNGLRQLIKKRLIFAALGFVMSCLFIMISDYCSNRLRTIMQCGNEDEIFGIIPFVDKVNE